MLAIHVELLHGVLRAGSPDDIALTGHDDRGEWPPSPARLFSALVAAAGCPPVASVGDGSELALLENADPPRILADPLTDVLTSRVHSRFVVADVCHVEPATRTTLAVHEYIARRAVPVRPGTRMAPRLPRVSYVWPCLDPSQGQLTSLAFRAARVGYLGCADSPVRLAVSREAPACPPDRCWTPTSSGGHALPVPYPGFTQALDAAYKQWLVSPVRRSWLPTRYAAYSQPGDAGSAAVLHLWVLWFRLHPPVMGHFALAVTETLRATTLDVYERHVGEPPPVLHGHGFIGSGRNHAQFLALPDVGFPYSSGRIHGVAVWLPPDTPAEVVGSLRAALWRVQELARPGWFRADFEPYGGEDRPWAACPARWSRPSRRWVSAYPVVHERWTSRGPDRNEVESWFRHAGFDCRVVEFRTSLAPLLPGSQRLRPESVHRRKSTRYPYSFFDIMLDHDIPGPVVIGRGRQFGMGLMAPGC